jgi:DNA-nicking Smr family endonuclease
VREKTMKKELIKQLEVPVHNLELGMPSLEEARKNLITIINEEKKRRHGVIKIIHGYGSSGVGGVLYHGLRKSLRLRIKEEFVILLSGKNLV